MSSRTPVNRLELAVLFSNLKFVRGAEIGVEKGIYSETLCQINPLLVLFCIDVWKPYPGYRDFVKSMRSNYKEAQTRLSQYNCVLMKKFSQEAVKEFEDESLDFVYIDADHELESVTKDIEEWSKKVKVGGIISGDDYGRSGGVKEAVDKYVKENKKSLLVMEDTSWMWVK